MNIAFAGFRHSHILVLYNMIKETEGFNILGAFEQNDAAREEAKKAGVVFNYASYEELLSDKNIEAVAIGDVYASRGALAISALKAGKHVICDKPLCTSLSELDEIERLSEEKGLAVSLMLTMRYEGICRAAKSCMAEIGEVKSVYFGGQHPLMYESRPKWYFEDGKHGGLINDLAIHGIDLVYYLCGQRIKNINAARCYNAYAVNEKNFADSGQFMAELENGAGLIADVSYSVPDSVNYSLPFYWQFYIWGERGVISFSANSESVTLFKNDSAQVINVSAESVPVNYAEDFLLLVGGKKPQLTTKEVILSARDTLEIQKFSEIF